MGAKRIEDLVAWQLAREFKLEVYRIVKASTEASADAAFRTQIMSAASSGEANITEGFHRFSLGDFARFLHIARASIAEAKGWVIDGVDRGYFREEDTTHARILADRSLGCVTSLRKSIEPFSQAARRPLGTKRSP